jgi:hypothetical protein
MEEDYIDQLYTHLGGDKSGIDKNAFRKDMSTNKEYNKQIFDYMKGESQGISYDAFLKDTFTPVKKKGATRPTLGSTPSGGSLESPKKSEVPINKKQQEQFLSQSNTLGDSLKGIESTVPKIADSTVVKDIQSKNLTIPDAQKQQQKERIEQEKGFMQSLIDTPIEALTSGVLNMVGGVSGLIGGVADVLIDKNPDAKYPIFSDKWIGRKIQQGGELENPSFGTNQWFRDTFMGASSTLSKVAGLESQDARKSIGVSDTSKSTIDHLLSGNIKDTGKSLVVDVIEQLPNIVLMASTGGSSGSLGVVGASSAGANLQEQYSQDQDISMTDLSQGIVMGITEVVTEKVFDLDVKGLSKIGGKLSDFLGSSGKDLKEKIAREGVEKVRNEIVRSTSDVLKQGAKGVKEEVLEENIVTVVDYFVKAIDEDVFNQEGFSQLLKDMGQSTLVAAASGGGISTIAAKASQVKFTKQESRKIEQYKEILANKNISLGTKNIAKNRIEEINAGVETATSERYDKIVALPIEDRIDILDKQAKIQTLEADKVATMDVEINSAIDERITELNAEIDAKINPKVEPALPSEISGFLTERNNETLSSVEQRIDNAELINENDIAGATSPLYDAIDGISKDKSLSEGDKQAAISLIEDKITKLESYEFETETKIIQPEQERPVLVSKQIIGKVTRGSKNPSEVTKGRFDGKQASVNETDGVIVYDEKADVLSVVHDDGRTDLDFNYLEYQESSLDEDGNLQSVKLVDKRNGDEVSINDQDLAYDIAIKAKTQQLGEIQDAVFDEVYETVKQEAITKEVVKEKPTIPLVNNNQEGVKQEKQQIKDFGVAEDQVEPVHNLISRLFQGLKESGLTAANTVGEWVGIGKGKEKPYSLKINGKDVQVKNTSPEVVNGFYSPLEKIISKAQVAELNTTLRVELNKVQKQLQDYYQAAKKGIAVELPNGVFWEKALKEQVAKLKEQISSSEVKTDNFSLTVDEWKSKLNESEEAKWTGLTDWLSQQEGSVSKADIQQYLKDNRIQVVEVVKGELTEKEIKEKDRLLKELDDVGVKITLSILDGDKVKQNELEAKEEELFEKLKPLSDRTNQDLTKFSQYQLEGEKENYKEVLVTMPSETNFEIVKWKDGGYVLKVNGNNYAFNESIDNLKQVQSEIENGKRKGDDAKFKSSHFDEPNILVHLRMNTRTDAEGNKVLFLEEVQSDWGQEGKRKGFNKEPKYKSMPSGNEFRNQIEKKLGNVQDIVIDKNEFGDSVVIRKDNKFYIADLENGKINVDEIYEADAPDFFKEYSTSIPSAPFVMDTNAWTKLGLKYALKEAVAQGVDKIAWTTGEQQNERYSLEKIADEVRYSKNPDGTYKIIAYKDGENISENKRLNEKDLESNFGKDVAQRIIDGVGENIEGEKSLTGENLKVGGKGMKGFYGSPTEGSLGIVGNVAKSLFKQEPKTVEIKVKGIADFNKVNTKKDIEVYSEQKYKFYENQEEVSKQRAYEIIEGGDWLTAKKPIESIQHSIDVTPELKESVEGGQPLFKDAEAQYRIESGKNIVEAIKDFNGSARAVVALTHEIMHPTVVAIIDGAKRNSKNGLKHTQTIIDEFNKANPKRKVTVEQLIQGNDDFKGGKTSKEYRAVQEFIAKSWEKYHREGGKGFSQQFQEVLEQIKKAFRDVYKSTSGKKLTPELRVMFDEILGKQNPTTSNQGGSNKPPTPPVVPPGNTNKGANQNEWERSKQMMVDQENLLAEMGKKKPFIQRFIKNWFERQQGIIKALGKGASADKVRTMMTTVAGARSYADEQFKRKEKGIFGKKSIEQEKTLDLHLFNRRVIEIDSNYDKNNQERIKHPEDVNKERALQAISELKQEIGDKAFDKLNKDADKYFEAMNEILGRMYEDGLISEAVYDKLKGDDYIQRVFIDHINDTADGRTKTLEDYGLKANQIKALSEGSTGLLLLDSRSLLSAAYRSVEQRVFQNNANKALAEFVSKTNNNKLGKEMKPKYKKDGTKEYGAADKGYTKIIHFKNGEIFATQLKKEYAAEWLDLEKTTTELDNRLRVLMGTALLKQMATGINATFAISNIPADYLNIIMFTDTFDNTNVFNAMVKLGLNFTTNFAELVALKSIGIGRPKFKELSDSFTKYGGGMEFLTTYGKPDELITRDKGIVKQVAGKVSNTAVNTLAFTGEQSERAMRFAVFDEVRTQLIKQNGGKSKLSPEKWDEINYTAAARARETMDFAKGGLLAKKADVVSPYFNAGAQGTRVAAEYVYKNPKKFASKWTQISGAAASLMLYNMMVGDEEDWANLSDKEKNSYFVVFNPFKKEGGKRGYYRIKKTPALAPFLVFAEAGAMAMYNQFTGKNWGGGDSVLHREWETVNDALPIPLDPRNLPNKLPPVPRSVLSYFANYDFYRKQKLVNGQEEDISSQYQGVTDEKIPDFYKKIGQVSANVTGGEGLSPKKLQKTTEMIITSPNTNPIIGGAYHFLDKLVNTFGDVPETWNSKDKEISQIFGGAKARVYREIDPEYGRYQDQSLKILQKDLASTKYLLRNEVSSSVENGATEKEIKSLIGSKELSDGEKTSLFNYAKSVKDRAYLAKTIPDYYKLAPVKYWRGSPEDKVKLFVNNMGLIDPKSEEFSSILKDMKRMEISTSPRFRDEYYKLYNNATQNKNK